MPTFDDDYALRRFRPALDEHGLPDPLTRGWLEADTAGFHVAARTDAEATRAVRYLIADDVELTGVWRTHPTPGSLDVEQPVATFASLPKELSFGDGHAVVTHAITSVTVRATDRRRGILRRMMTEDLERAAAAGRPVASLTASEGTIYRRFGFGPAVRERIVEVDRAAATPFLTGPIGSVPGGTVVAVDPATLADGVAQDVYARFHARTPGSMVRNAEDLLRLLGREGTDGEPDRSVRAFVHRPSQASGADLPAVDGYVTYRPDRKDGGSARIDVVDLVAATDEAYLALWDALLAIDLIRTVRWETAPLEDPLLHVLADNRAYRVVREKEHVWLRVLDVVAALSARSYVADGSLTLDVRDALGIADGRYRLTVRGGTGHVERLDGPDPSGSASAQADLTLDVADLGALLLGGVRVQTLVAAGLVVEGRSAAAALLTAMSAAARGVHGIAYF